MHDGAQGAPTSGPVLTVSACVPDAGCVSQVECARACDPARQLTRQACDERISAAGALMCEDDADCPGGSCRQEVVGALCVDALSCAEDGHCGDGGDCLIDPDTLDEGTGLPTRLGECSDGRGGSLCYEDDDCVYERCDGSRCSSGELGRRCRFGSECASGFCRVSNPNDGVGTCVSGEHGGSCIDDADCKDALHCAGGVCVGSGLGQGCEDDSQCDTGLCVAARCRSGELGAHCEDMDDCNSEHCVRSVCVSGSRDSPCQQDADCEGDLRCGGDRCGDGTAGSRCSGDDQCSTLGCVRGLCSSGERGDACSDDGDCAGGQCVREAGTVDGECTDGTPGAYCNYATDCNSMSCDSLTRECGP